MRFFLAFVALFCVVSAEVVKHYPCEGQVGSCVVHEVRVDPCPEAVDEAPCKIKRGRTANISFDYTPGFESSSPHGQVYWASPEGDLPFAGMNTDACSHTSCPVAAATKQTYTYAFETSKKYPARNYEIKWKLQPNADSTESCCFTTKIRLTK